MNVGLIKENMICTGVIYIKYYSRLMGIVQGHTIHGRKCKMKMCKITCAVHMMQLCQGNNQHM